VDDESPAPWGVELEPFEGPVAYHSVRKAGIDGGRVTFLLANGQTVSYGFKDIKRVLFMHSLRADYQDSAASKID
jgi:hypothetical protein